MQQTVIFDMDGVIIDSEPTHIQIERQIFDELGLAIPLAEHFTFVGTSSKNMWERIISKYNLSWTVNKLMEREQNLFNDVLSEKNTMSPVPGAVELIHKLHTLNFKLVLASSSAMENINLVLSKFNIADLFSAKVSGTKLNFAKPHPEIFLLAARLAGSQPEECVVIEDSENGVRAAKSAGMKCIGLLNPNSGNQNLNFADLVITSFSEINMSTFKLL